MFLTLRGCATRFVLTTQQLPSREHHTKPFDDANERKHREKGNRSVVEVVVFMGELSKTNEANYLSSSEKNQRDGLVSRTGDRRNKKTKDDPPDTSYVFPNLSFCFLDGLGARKILIDPII